MRHRINGISINLRELTEYELSALVKMAQTRIDNAEDDLEKLEGEKLRRVRQSEQLALDI